MRKENDVPIVRIVVDGCPSLRSEGTNFGRARKMLLRAFADNGWPGNAMFAVTPGGFVKAPFPDDWGGRARMELSRRRLQRTCPRGPESPWMKC